MNNKEKREYIDCLTLLDQQCFFNELETRNKVLRKCPPSFFKYRSFDKFAFEMIREGYAYLSPVNHLDDPFDCISDFDISGMVNINNISITERFLFYIIKSTGVKYTDQQIERIKRNVQPFINNGNFDVDKVIEVLKEEGLQDDESEAVTVFMGNLLNVYGTYLSDSTFDKFGKIALNPGDMIGVCSLSEENNNKVMWSLYGKKYKGYCIEYVVAPTNKARRFLCPVIYSREPNNNFSRKMFDSIFAQTKRAMLQGDFFANQNIERIGSIYELFCTKDIDWKYQKEWRIIGSAGGHFTDIVIKAVYLGYDVSETNEAKMIRYAKKYKFDLYKMKAPDGKKKIRFKRISK